MITSGESRVTDNSLEIFKEHRLKKTNGVFLILEIILLTYMHKI